MKQHIRYGNKNEDGTVTWGDWQEIEVDSNFKIYTSLEQLGLTADATIKDIWENMPLNSKVYINVDTFSDTSQFPISRAILEITKGNNHPRAAIHLYGKTSDEGDYRMFLTESNPPDGVWWKIPYEQVNTTSLVADDETKGR